MITGVPVFISEKEGCTFFMSDVCKTSLQAADIITKLKWLAADLNPTTYLWHRSASTSDRPSNTSEEEDKNGCIMQKNKKQNPKQKSKKQKNPVNDRLTKKLRSKWSYNAKQKALHLRSRPKWLEKL